MTGKRFARLAAAVAVCLLVLAAFVVQLLGGKGSVPGWQQLRAALGVPLQTEESAPQTADGSTVVYVLDVGQGDAVLLCQDGAYCLIDTGPVEAEDALLYDLDVLGVPSLDYLVLTHPHADHTGNARAVLRAIHYFEENARTLAQRDALQAGQFDAFAALVLESGRASFALCQNVYCSTDVRHQGLSVALALSQSILQGSTGAWRMQGGGFAGTIQAYVPQSLLERYHSEIERVFGKGSCYILRLREQGAVKVI